MTQPLLTVEIRSEQDVVAARQRARQVAGLLGFEGQDQTRIATAVSELARNAFRYAGGGTVGFTVAQAPDGPQQSLVVSVDDEGPGLRDLAAVLEGRYRSTTGLGIGIIGTRRLMDSFNIESAPGAGTSVRIGKALPRRAPPLTADRLAAVADELARCRIDDPFAEVQQQNRELLRSLEELRLRQEELAQLNAELADTNRGVLALYAELDERAEHLRRADETKTRFLSSMSHEFRTPVNAIRALSRLLLERADGDLTFEQEKQVLLIRRAAESLGELVDDLLDLAKVTAGKAAVRPEAFTTAELFGALRGMLRPLLVNPDVTLIFDDPIDLPPLLTDQGKVAQILRNFISNALKFTERGSVRVSATLADGGAAIVFSVADTGIGIAPEEHERIFDEFSQVESKLQRRVKGTGLGLAVSKRLADLLGGSISLRSTLGRGSTFSLLVPRAYGSLSLEPAEAGGVAADASPRAREGGTMRVLVIDDDDIARYTLRQFLPSGRFHVTEAADGAEGLRLARQLRPDLLFLDLAMPGMQGPEVLDRLMADEETKAIPVIIFTSRDLDPEDRDRLSAARVFLPKAKLSREALLDAIREIRGSAGAQDAGRA